MLIWYFSSSRQQISRHAEHVDLPDHREMSHADWMELGEPDKVGLARMVKQILATPVHL